MSQNRTRHSAEFKAKVALAALAEAKTLAEISSEYKVHSTQIRRWKQEVLENAAQLFGKGNIFIERLWRSLKYERIYLKAYETGVELCKDLKIWFTL
jgi:transposase-like protein